MSSGSCVQYAQVSAMQTDGLYRELKCRCTHKLSQSTDAFCDILNQSNGLQSVSVILTLAFPVEDITPQGCTQLRLLMSTSPKGPMHMSIQVHHTQFGPWYIRVRVYGERTLPYTYTVV